ncbi:MAG: Lactate utilization protein A [Gammaproteobacteria bacterium]|nr:Lactate utilization protein A [Gammaproteobacteria bacterium]
MSDHAKPPRVGLFVTCLVDLFRPNIGFASIKLLEQAGCEVDVPAQQTCCGQPAFNSGDYDATRRIAKQVIEVFEKYDYAVGPSGSCMATMRAHYRDLFEDDPPWLERVDRFGERVYELLSFLTDVMGVARVDAGFAATATYHDSCSGLRELGVKQQPRRLLESVSGFRLQEMDDSEVCCGFGGTFCVKYPEISARMVTDKIAAIEASGADTLIGGDLGCLMNMGGRLSRLGKPVKVYHTAEILADMAGGPAIGEVDAE